MCGLGLTRLEMPLSWSGSIDRGALAGDETEARCEAIYKKKGLWQEIRLPELIQRPSPWAE